MRESTWVSMLYSQFHLFLEYYIIDGNVSTGQYQAIVQFKLLTFLNHVFNCVYRILCTYNACKTANNELNWLKVRHLQMSLQIFKIKMTSDIMQIRMQSLTIQQSFQLNNGLHLEKEWGESCTLQICNVSILLSNCHVVEKLNSDCSHKVRVIKLI